MAIFTKSNRSILNNGRVDWEGNQNMGGKRVRYAGEEVDLDDYVIKKTLDNHTHTGLGVTMHDNTNHLTSSYGTGYVGNHDHSENFMFRETDGWIKFPSGLEFKWGRRAYDVADIQYKLARTITFNDETGSAKPFDHGCLSAQLSTLQHGSYTSSQTFAHVECSINFFDVGNIYANIRRIAGQHHGAGEDGAKFYVTYQAWGY